MAADLQTLLSYFLNDLYAGTLGVTLPITQVRGGLGTVTVPTYSFAGDTGTGFYRTFASQIGVANNGVETFIFAPAASGGFRAGASVPVGWSSATDPFNAANDTGLSRTAAATLAVGNGTAGDVSGTVNATIFKSGATAGVTTFGPAAVASITVKGGIITAIS